MAQTRSSLADQMTAIAADYGELAKWQEVPGRVATLFKQASDVKRQVMRLVKHLPTTDPGYGQVWWHPKKKELWASLADGDNEQIHHRWHTALRAIPDVQHVHTVAECQPSPLEEWVRIKRAAALSVANAPFELAGKLTGGPTPLTNAIVGGLLGGGLGYGAGAVLETLVPDRFIDRGRLRQTLGLLGTGVGVMPAIKDLYYNMQIARDAGKPMNIFEGAVTPDSKLPIGSHENLLAQNATLAQQLSAHMSPYELERYRQKMTPFFKAAADFAGTFGTDPMLKPVPVDAFNNAIWNDVGAGIESSRYNPYGTKSQWGDNTQGMHTPPAVGAAATGLVSGINSLYGNPGYLSSSHFVNGLWAAGKDLATANIAGRILGALGGMSAPAQRTLQDMGLWGGLIRGVTGSVLGL